MSRYDLRFSVGLDEASSTKFKDQLNKLLTEQKIKVTLDTEQFNIFKNALKQGLETTVKIRVDTSELEKAFKKHNLVDFNGITSAGDYLSKNASNAYQKQIDNYKSVIDEYKKAESNFVKYGDKILAESGADTFTKSLLKKTGDADHDKLIDKYNKYAEEMKQVKNRLLTALVGLQDDERFQNETLTRRFKSWEAFNNSLMDSRVKASRYYMGGFDENSLDDLKSNFKGLRNELQSITESNGIKSFIDIDKLSIQQLAEATNLLDRMEKINEKIVGLNGGSARSKLKIGNTREQTELFLHYRDAFNQAFENGRKIVALSEQQPVERAVTPQLTTEAVSDLAKTLATGLNNVPINSFSVSAEAITAVKEQVQAQLQNIKIGKTITLSPSSDKKSKEERIVLPNVVIGSIELSADAITKLREDTQRALNNVTLVPSADEATFSQVFERVSKSYQRKLNTLARKLNTAIDKPTIEEFDATPAIEKLKEQINAALKSFKFDINGRVAHGTISTGLDESGRYAYKTYESLEKAVGKMTSGANSNISKLTGWGNTAGASETLASYNALLAQIENFKAALRETDAEGKLVMPLEEANKQMAAIVAQSHKLEDSFNEVAIRNSIGKTLDNTADNIVKTVKTMNAYQDTDEIQNLRVRLIGENDAGGVLSEILALKESLPNKTIAEANTEMMTLLSRVEQLTQEFAEVGANTPMTKELERAAVDADNLQRRLVGLQERMQKALTANSRGFSIAGYRNRFDEIYSATQHANLSSRDINRLDLQFKTLMQDMRQAGVTGKSFGDIMRGMYAKFGNWTMVTMTIQRVIMMFKRMIAAVQEVDTALTNLRKVTSATESDLNRFMKGVGDSAYKMGSSISDLINATAEFSRLGYDLNQSQRLGELATMYKSVAEDLDITTASQSIVSTLKAYEKAGITAERIVDVFNYVGNNFAISSAGIGEAMQRSAASLQTANNSLEQSVALITAANEVAQDPIKVGTAMKTLSARIRGSKTELTELGEDMDFLAEGTSKLRNEIKALSGVDIMLDNTTFKSTYQIIDELSMAYQGMVETSQARLAELLGGKNQANIVSALLENFDTARKTLKDATESADGSAAKELETALDSINGKVNQLSASWQKFSTDLLESDLFKNIIDGASKLLQLLDGLIGGSNTLIKLAPMVLAGFGMAKNKTPLGLLQGLLPNKLSRSQLQAQLADYYIEVAATASMTRDQYFAQFTDGSRDILRGYVDSVDDINTASVDGIVAYQNEALSQMNAGASKYLGMLKNIGSNLLMVVGTEMAIKFGEFIWENLSFTQAHKDKIAKLADEATSALNEALDKNKNNLASVDQMVADFQRLSEGVSRTGENLSLTNEQYSTYKSYVEQLIEINPALIEGINSQGDAFINNKTAIEETTKALKEQQRAIYAGFFNGKENSEVLENLVDRYEESIGKISSNKGFDPSLIYQIRENIKSQNAFGGLDKLFTDVNKEDKEYLRKILEMGDDDSLWSESVYHPEDFARRLEKNREEILRIASEYGDKKWISSQLDTNRDLLIQLDQEREQLEQIGNEFDEYVDKYARSRSEYYNLTEQQTHILDNLIESYDFSGKMFADGADEDAAERQMRVDINNYIKFLDGLSGEVEAKMEEISNIDKSNIKYDNYRTQINEVINDIISDPTYNADILPEKNLRVLLGVDFETDNGEIKNEYEDMIKNIVNRYKQNLPSNLPENQYGSFLTRDIENRIRKQLTPDQIAQLFNMEDSNIFSSWDKMFEAVTVKQRFTLETYQEILDTVTKNLSTLGDAFQKFKMGEFTTDTKGATEEVMKLTKEFPELNNYVDYTDKGFGRLGEGLVHLINTEPDKLLKNIAKLGELTAADRKEVEQLKAAVKGLQIDALGGAVSWVVQQGLTESDYVDYVLKDYDKIIKKLEEQKEGTEKVNEELEDQKEKLEKIVDEYEIAGNTVIKTLEKKISDITDYYDEQINKLKEENDEIEKNIDLQKKMDALTNARKTKIRVYNETEGWHYESDTAAIEEAERELEKAQREIKISELEKQRDNEIKLWDEYKEAWQDAMDEYTNAHNEAITEGILGVEWRENVMSRDESMLESYRQNYRNFQANLDTSIDKQIKKNKEYIDSIDKKIKEYEKDKTAIQDWVEEQNNQKSKYFDLIDEITIKENSSWEDRLHNIEEFKKNYKRIMDEIREANSEIPPPENPKVSIQYLGSDSEIKKNGIFDPAHPENNVFTSEAEANNVILSLARQIRSKRIAGIPSGLLSEDYLEQMLREIIQNFRIVSAGSFAGGGVIDKTGLAQVHGSRNSAEVALNSSQAKVVYDFIASGTMSKATTAMALAYNKLLDALPAPVLSGSNMPKISMVTPEINSGKNQTNEINISFPNATIEAKDYDSFKGFMDRYTNDLLLKMQVGL